MSKDAMLERQAMLKHMLMANKMIDEQNHLAEDAGMSCDAQLRHAWWQR